MEMCLKVQALMPLVEQVLEANQPFAQAHQVSLQLQQSFDALVEVDAGRLQQVLSNLISNAAKFSPEQTRVQVLVSQHGKQVRVAVQDQGPGIPAAFQSRIFQKFAQADSADTRLHGGTGLGLAISKQLIEQMHGSIGFSSVEGEGALFYIDLPLCQP
jgi:signal transduction histidine kinase